MSDRTTAADVGDMASSVVPAACFRAGKAQ